MKEEEKEMEWRVRESSYGYYAERGSWVSGETLSVNGIGYYMKTFVVSESARFDDPESARRYIRERETN